MACQGRDGPDSIVALSRECRVDALTLVDTDERLSWGPAGKGAGRQTKSERLGAAAR